MKTWKKWAIGAPVGAFVALVVAMFVSEGVLLRVGWTTPFVIVFLAGAGLVVAAAVKYLRRG
jgi:hypothetical protein